MCSKKLQVNTEHILFEASLDNNYAYTHVRVNVSDNSVVMLR